MPNLLAPVARQRIFTDVGVVAPGAQLFTLVSGSPSTPLATTSDAAGLVPNANPIIASAGGLFGPIYLTPNLAYHFRLTDAAGVPIWDQDPVTAGTGGALSVPGGGTGLASLAPPYGVLTAGTTPTGPAQIVAPSQAGFTLISGGPAALPAWAGNGAPIVINHVGGGALTLNAQFGTVWYLSAGGDFTLGPPGNPTDGQKMVIRFNAVGAGRTLILTNWAGGAVPGGFRFGASVPGPLTQTPVNLTDYVGCLYFGATQSWDVVAYVKGF